MKITDLKPIALNAYKGISFSPEKRGLYIYEELLKQYETVDNKQKFIQLAADWLIAESRCMSPMITGPSNFPVNSNNKKNDSARNKCDKFYALLNKKEVISHLPPEDELDKAIKEVDVLIIKQIFMKKANKEFKKGLSELGAPDTGMKRFETFELTNNNAKIKARRDKILIMKARIQTKETFKIIEFEGGYIDIENDRVIIKHEEKPEREIIDKIKARGFRWSRNYGCWCRKHTAQALYDAKEIVLWKKIL